MDGKDFKEFEEICETDKMLEAIAIFTSNRLFKFLADSCQSRNVRSQDIEIMGETVLAEFYTVLEMHFSDKYMELSWDTEDYNGNMQKEIRFHSVEDMDEEESNRILFTAADENETKLLNQSEDDEPPIIDGDI